MYSFVVPGHGKVVFDGDVGAIKNKEDSLIKGTKTTTEGIPPGVNSGYLDDVADVLNVLLLFTL